MRLCPPRPLPKTLKNLRRESLDQRRTFSSFTLLPLPRDRFLLLLGRCTPTPANCAVRSGSLRPFMTRMGYGVAVSLDPNSRAAPV